MRRRTNVTNEIETKCAASIVLTSDEVIDDAGRSKQCSNLGDWCVKVRSCDFCKSVFIKKREFLLSLSILNKDFLEKTQTIDKDIATILSFQITRCYVNVLVVRLLAAP